MSKQRRASLIISIIALVLPIAGNLYSIHFFAFPAFSFASFKGVFTVPIIIISLVSFVLSLRYHDENVCLALIAINIMLCIIPYSYIAIKGEIPSEALIISYTDNLDDYLVIDEYRTDFINKEAIFDALPDEKDENVELVSYKYKYFTNLFYVLQINSSFSTTMDYYPSLIERLETVGFKKIDDPDCYARYTIDESFTHEFIDVKFSNDGFVEYYCYCLND